MSIAEPMAPRRAAVEYDPRRPEWIADPFPIFARLRAEEPVHWNEVLGGWVLTRYRHVRQLLNDPRFSADRITPFRDHLAPDARAKVSELLKMLGLWAVFNDPPEHTRRRALLNKAFTPRAVAALRPMIAAIVGHLIDRAAHGSEMDLIGDFAYPLPASVIAGMIGVPIDDLDRFKRWSDDIAAFVGSALASPDKRDRAERGMREIAEYFRAMIVEHRRSPRDDILSALIAAQEGSARLSEDEVVASSVLLLFAGHETTTNLIGNGMLALLRHPEAQAGLAADPDLAQSAVEEMLRYDGPTQAMTRIAREAVEIEPGLPSIAMGERVFVLLNSANRDGEIFQEPDRFDIRRGDTRHISFGYGIHFCLGAPLARLEGEIAIRTLVQRLPGLALATREPEWSDSFVLRGVKALPVRFRRDTR
ncbi:MAG TPA: cytochrome P450 [Stellaceae bacterium]|nr:cytochrome P450 [Stellaceae bacterium]